MMMVMVITGRGGLYGCEVLRIPHCLDSRLTDGGEFRLTYRRVILLQNIFYF
jgi:hypothetical protein